MELASTLSMHTFDAMNGFLTCASQSALKEPNATPDLLDLSQTELKTGFDTKCSALRASTHQGADLLQDLLLPGEFIS